MKMVKPDRRVPWIDLEIIWYTFLSGIFINPNIKNGMMNSVKGMSFEKVIILINSFIFQPSLMVNAVIASK